MTKGPKPRGGEARRPSALPLLLLSFFLFYGASSLCFTAGKTVDHRQTGELSCPEKRRSDLMFIKSDKTSAAKLSFTCRKLLQLDQGFR